MKIDKNRLDRLYHKYNKREYVHPDPLEFLYNYNDIKDREIVGMVASALAYGRVGQILKSVSHVLDIMGSSPSLFLREASFKSLNIFFDGFKHRFATGAELASMLMGAKNVIGQYGSLYECFVAGLKKEDKTILPAMTLFVRKIVTVGNKSPGHLMPLPERGSGCKRMNLFLRWMVRKDDVDPGGWDEVPSSKLIIPLDTHMHRICQSLGLTRRKQANMRTALEATDAFKKIVPEDPVRYDFALTRLGIRDDTDLDGFLNDRHKK